MEAIIFDRKDYEQLKNDLKEIKAHVKKITVPSEAFIDNKEFAKLFNISYRTAQMWRDEGKIGFSQEGGKIYYRLSDIDAFLEGCHHKPFDLGRKVRKVLAP